MSPNDVLFQWKVVLFQGMDWLIARTTCSVKIQFVGSYDMIAWCDWCHCADCEESDIRRTNNTVWTALDNIFKFHLHLNGVLTTVSGPLLQIRTPKPSMSEPSLPIHSLSLLSTCSRHHHPILSMTLLSSSSDLNQCSIGHSLPHQLILLVRNLISHQTTLPRQMQTHRDDRSAKWPTSLRSQARLPSSYVARLWADHWLDTRSPIIWHSNSGWRFNDSWSWRSMQGSI